MRLPERFLMMVLVFSLLLAMSCQDRGRLSGRYAAGGDENQDSLTISLELMANGQGSWSIEEDNVSFKWEIRENEIWLHTKSGGVIVGKIVGETIEINLPAAGEYYFKKVSCQIRRGQERRLFRFKRP